MNEILSEDLRPVTTVKLNEGAQALMPRPLFTFVSSEEIGTVDFKTHGDTWTVQL
jgi:hypothetical protein